MWKVETKPKDANGGEIKHFSSHPCPLAKKSGRASWEIPTLLVGKMSGLSRLSFVFLLNHFKDLNRLKKKKSMEPTLTLRIQTDCRARTSAQTSKVVYSALTFGCTIKLMWAREKLWSKPLLLPVISHTSSAGLRTSPALMSVLDCS